ncbi:MAG TPA: cellulose binding domain-containing protein [Bacillota bacterium]|nr:cellulose binding domain-containing protein [Bacillota bacterium]
MSKTTFQRIALSKITWSLVIIILLVSVFITQLAINAATGELRLDLDKTALNVGDIIKCSVKINTISNFAGLQVNIKYDPTVLQAVDPNSGAVYTNSSLPANGDLLLNSAYSPLTIPDHNISNGVLNFGRAYVNLSAFKNAGTPEASGTVALIGFKALKTGNTSIAFQDNMAMPGGSSGTMIFDWSGNAVSGYSVIHPPSITISGPTPTPTRRSNVTPTPTLRRPSTPTPTSRRNPTPTPTPTVRRVNTSTPTFRLSSTPTSRQSSTPTPTSGGGTYGVSYVIQSDWGNGATISITIKNITSTVVNGWTLAWTFPGAQMITNLWNGAYSQSGSAVSVKDAGFNANIPAGGGTVNFGFNLNYTGTNAKPTAFTLNGTACQIQ